MAKNSSTLAALVVLFVSPAFAEQTNAQAFSPVFYAFENGVSFGSGLSWSVHLVSGFKNYE